MISHSIAALAQAARARAQAELVTRLIARGQKVHVFSRDEFVAMADIGEKKQKLHAELKLLGEAMIDQEGRNAYAPLPALMDEFWKQGSANVALIQEGRKEEAFAFLVDKTIPARNALLAPLALEKKRQGERLQFRIGEVQDAKIRLHQRKDGTVFEVRAHLSRLDFDGRAACLVLAEDVSERLAYERELAYHASHHPQTGLLNTRALAEALDECGEGYTVAFIQLRGLRLISDALGSDIGDAVLKEFAARLRRNIRGVDLACRFGGEEFLIVLVKTDLEQARNVLEQLRREQSRVEEQEQVLRDLQAMLHR